MSTAKSLAPRSVLFVPASNPRAIAKARSLDADMIVLDLEDGVAPADKTAARDAAERATEEDFGGRAMAIRVNAADSDHYRADLGMVAAARVDYLVVPKAERTASLAECSALGAKPLLPMIETATGVLAAADLARVRGVAGLIAGVNDLKADLGIPARAGREGLTLALQTVVLAARAAGVWATDGVFNGLDDEARLTAECHEGRAMGFDGKSLIHPAQVASVNRAFAPGPSEIEDARALIAAAVGGAQRFRGRMVETLHVEQARTVLARAEAL